MKHYLLGTCLAVVAAQVVFLAIQLVQVWFAVPASHVWGPPLGAALPATGLFLILANLAYAMTPFARGRPSPNWWALGVAMIIAPAAIMLLMVVGFVNYYLL